ncbi:butyrophilin subfamily 1 member A1-like [Sardina pilchardus]|uniref:butyrophilin subfamily 1 member A1-like n=1 Tax=Sardina pilchardus TaxID=27697 RepID=UPI002E1683E6
MRKGNIVDLVILLLTCPQLVYTSAVSLDIGRGSRDEPCGGGLSLDCSINTSGTPQSLFMSWLSLKEELCTIKDGQINQANSTLCHYNSKTLTLTVTLLAARALSQETYYCKMRSNLGVGGAEIAVQPPAVCEGLFQHTALQSPPREECVFYDVYPEDQVLWFSDGKDLTVNTSSTSLRGANGLFNISSILPRQENMSNLSCRLSRRESGHAIPDRQAKVVPTPAMAPSSLNSSSSSADLHWPLFFTGLLMLSQVE